ncbi:hypothetical protein ACQ4WQ_17715 [Janthinobacterium sp. GB1R12]|uniref:hypothetical protein n=1 Tax=unclassified Janthinobacterium TaxID=2610881 RepID=UPI003F21628E
MSAGDKKPPKGPEKILISLNTEGFDQFLQDALLSEDRENDVLHIYGPIKSRGSRKQRTISQLTSQFEQLLLNGSEETLREVLRYINALGQAKAAPPSSPPTKLFVLGRSAAGKLSFDEGRKKPGRTRASSTVGGGTGSTGPGIKPRGRK